MNPNRRNNYLAASIALALGGTTLALAHDQSTRTVGPQSDGSYIVSDNQRITPAGKLVDLGSPVRAKAVAVNPKYQTKTGAVMLMGASEPIIIFNTATGEVMMPGHRPEKLPQVRRPCSVVGHDPHRNRVVIECAAEDVRQLADVGPFCGKCVDRH